MEKKELTALENEQSALLKEFEDSKLGVDEFILKYFKEKGVADPEATLKRMDETFRVIDTCYDALKAAKESGDDRKVIFRKLWGDLFLKLFLLSEGKLTCKIPYHMKVLTLLS